MRLAAILRRLYALIEAVDDQIELEGATIELAAELTFREGDPESAVRELTDFLAKGRSPLTTPGA